MKLVYEVCYRHAGKKYKEKFDFDLSVYRDVLFRSFKDTEGVLREGLRDISQNIHTSPHERILSQLRAMTEELCPVCKERIKKGALKCRFCGEWLKEKANA